MHNSAMDSYKTYRLIGAPPNNVCLFCLDLLIVILCGYVTSCGKSRVQSCRRSKPASKPKQVPYHTIPYETTFLGLRSVAFQFFAFFAILLPSQSSMEQERKREAK